jgi:hypothetical protein
MATEAPSKLRLTAANNKCFMTFLPICSGNELTLGQAGRNGPYPFKRHPAASLMCCKNEKYSVLPAIAALFGTKMI